MRLPAYRISQLATDWDDDDDDDDVVPAAVIVVLGWAVELAEIDRQQRALVARRLEVVARALGGGASIAAVGRALGISRQTAFARYSRLRH